MGKLLAVDVGNSKPPDVLAVVFEKGHRKKIESILGKKLAEDEPARPGRWKKEIGGGQNILVDPSDLEKILGLIYSINQFQQITTQLYLLLYMFLSNLYKTLP